MLPMPVAAAFLLVAGSWWAIAIAAWMRWERRHRSPGRYRAWLEERASGKKDWTIADGIVFGMPIVLPIGLALDGFFLGGVVFYEPAWSFFSPWTLSLQVAGLASLLVALPVFTWAAYLTAKHVFSKLPEERVLLQHGPYRHIRHPIYLTFILLGVGLVLLAESVLMLPTLVLLANARYSAEEQELLRLFGTEYVEYRRRTGALLPRMREPR